MTRSDASLKGKIKAMAKKTNLKPQELLQMYLFEHLLMRLEKSDYAETFVLKGGLLISSITGVAQRTTMDMDATVVGMDMDEGTVSAAISSICSVDVGDGMEYSFERLKPIRAAVLEEVRESSTMQGIWSSYVAGSPYAAGLDFEDVVDSALDLARLAELGSLEQEKRNQRRIYREEQNVPNKSDPGRAKTDRRRAFSNAGESVSIQEVFAQQHRRIWIPMRHG